jgi:hypothetical protein
MMFFNEAVLCTYSIRDINTEPSKVLAKILCDLMDFIRFLIVCSLSSVKYALNDITT